MLKDVVIVDHARMKFFLEHSYAKKQALFVWGTFGIGKSFMVNQFGKQMAKELSDKKSKIEFSDNIFDIGKDKFTVGTLSAHQISPGDVPGLPFPDRERGKTVYLLSELLPEDPDSQGILFVDEINLAPQLVQANLYSLIWDRKIGRYKLPDKWIVIGAGNTNEDRAHVQEMSMPLKNRYGHIQLAVPSVDKWDREFAQNYGIDSRITIFLRFREDLLHHYDPKGMDERYAVPTPRTWQMASDAIKGEEDMTNIRDLVGQFVGMSAGMQLTAHLEMANSYDIKKIFTKKKVDVPQEPDKAYALISAVCEYYKKHKAEEENTETIIDLMKSFRKEHAVIIIRQARTDNPEFFGVLKKINKAKLLEATTTYGPLL